MTPFRSWLETGWIPRLQTDKLGRSWMVESSTILELVWNPNTMGSTTKGAKDMSLNVIGSTSQDLDRSYHWQTAFCNRRTKNTHTLNTRNSQILPHLHGFHNKSKRFCQYSWWTYLCQCVTIFSGLRGNHLRKSGPNTTKCMGHNQHDQTPTNHKLSILPQEHSWAISTSWLHTMQIETFLCSTLPNKSSLSSYPYI